MISTVNRRGVHVLVQVSSLQSKIRGKAVSDAKKQTVLIEPGTHAPIRIVQIDEDFVRSHERKLGRLFQGHGHAKHLPYPVSNIISRIQCSLLEPGSALQCGRAKLKRVGKLFPDSVFLPRTRLSRSRLHVSVAEP